MGETSVGVAALQGGTLRQLLLGQGPLPVEDAAPLIAQIAQSLETLHQRAERHGELCPENVWLLSDGQLGLEADRKMPVRSRSPLPAGYRSPEHLRHQPLRFATDIWQLGAVLYELLTGQSLPADGSLYPPLGAGVQVVLPPLPDAAVVARPILERALAAAPGDRYVAATTLAEELRLSCLLQPIHRYLPIRPPEIPTGDLPAAAKNTVFYAAMSDSRGVTLRRRFQDCEILTIEEAATILQQIARSVDRVHRQGERHGEIFPENVWFLQDGQAQLYRRGGAPAAGAAQPRRGYLSPEEARGETPTFLTDIWSLGGLLYEMLIGALQEEGMHAVCTARGALLVTL